MYSENGGVWTQAGGDINGESAEDQFGHSVSLPGDGNRVAIGAYLNDGSGTNAGHVRVYAASGGDWTLLGDDIDGEAPVDVSGWTVSISAVGTRVAIGVRANDGNGAFAGHVRVYEEQSLGVNAEMGDQQELEIFPDPADNEVTFHLHSLKNEAAELALLDYSGRAIWQKTLKEGQHQLTLDLSGKSFPSGIYFVKVSSASNVLTKQLVILR